MFCNKATWPGSLCACSSCDPGSGGASRARGILPLTNELPGQVAFFALALCRAKGDTTMVCASVPYLGYKPQLCLARPMLFAALDRLDRGDTIGAGVLLREAVSRFLIAAANYYDVQLPKLKRKYPRPADIARAIHKAGHLGDWGLSCIEDIITAGNRLAHCQHVDARELRDYISLLFGLMDREPFCPNDRQPIVTTWQAPQHDEDDEGGACCWKGGAV